jgi:hypothetical protein
MADTIPPETQLDTFRLAVDALGGIRPAARKIGVTERTMGRLLSGASPLHTGFLADIGTALLDQAQTCRALERRLNPAFISNLTADQRIEKRDGRRAGTQMVSN